MRGSTSTRHAGRAARAGQQSAQPRPSRAAGGAEQSLRAGGAATGGKLPHLFSGEAAAQVEDAVDRGNVRQEGVPEALALGSALDESGNVRGRQHGRDLGLGLEVVHQPVEAIILRRARMVVQHWRAPVGRGRQERMLARDSAHSRQPSPKARPATPPPQAACLRRGASAAPSLEARGATRRQGAGEQRTTECSREKKKGSTVPAGQRSPARARGRPWGRWCRRGSSPRPRSCCT